MPTPEIPTPYTDLAECRALLCTGSRSFWFASRILPSNLRNAACGLYAFCREADDAIDDGEDPKLELQKLHHRLDQIYAGASGMSSTDRVLARIVRETHLPRALIDGLLEGFKWDSQGMRYETYSDLYAYCARVAGSVGVMMCVLMGVRDRDALARASDLGVAMQLSNIARDVGEDARAGRLYLPTEALKHHGVDPEEFLHSPTFTAPIAQVIAEILDRAEELYTRSEHGISSLPMTCRPGIYAARRLYAGIGHQVRDNAYDSLSQRAHLNGRQKLALLTRTPKCFALPDQSLRSVPLGECAFLIDAVTGSPPPKDEPSAIRPGVWGLPQRLTWMLDAVATLEQRSSPREPDADC